MANEEEVAVEEVESTDTPSRGSAKKIGVIAVLVVLVGVGGFVGWKMFLSEKSGGGGDPSAAEARASEKETPQIRAMHEMKPFIVNLMGENGRRYLKVKIIAEVGNQTLQEELTKRDPEIRDNILLVLAGKSFEDINTSQGKTALRSELLQRVNSVLQAGSVRMLYFTEFVVQ